VAPDGSWLAAASDDGVRVWDPVTGALRHTLTGHTFGVTKLVVAPDGSWLASASADGEVRVWDPATGATRYTLTSHPRWVEALEAWVAVLEALVVAPDGSWLASAGYGGEVRVWDQVTGTARHTLTGHTSQVVALGVAPDGSWLASASAEGEVRIWDPATGAPLTSLRVAGRLSHLVVTPAALAAGGEHGPYFLTIRRPSGA
jgi:WD40 repeat protein